MDVRLFTVTSFYLGRTRTRSSAVFLRLPAGREDRGWAGGSQADPQPAITQTEVHSGLFWPQVQEGCVVQKQSEPEGLSTLSGLKPNEDNINSVQDQATAH